jgi:tripartite-type tricarboxylate transporter receptor subunit TctC
MKRHWKIIALFAVLSLICGGASPQSKRPVRIIVGSAPGGPSDVQIRLLLPKMTEHLGQTLIVDNRPSNNGVLAQTITAQANPDGYTISVGNSGTHAVNATLYAKLPYDPLRDFTPVTMFSTSGMVLAANPRLPGTSLQDLVTAAKKQAGAINVAIPGATGQLAGDALWTQLGIRMNNVPYKGSSPSELAVVSGEADLALLTPLASARHIKAGKMKAYGLTSRDRHPLLPDVPTVAEQGVRGYDFQFWNGLFAPARTPGRVVHDYREAVVHALRAPDIRERFDQLGLVVAGNTPEDFARIVRDDIEKFRKIIIESGIPRL